MQTTDQSTPVSKKMIWTGRVMSALPVLLLLMSGVMKVMQTKDVVDAFTKQGYPASALLWIGIAELGCTVVYLIPRTAVLGAILLTGYLGGATDSIVRGGGPVPFIFPIIFGVLVWGGLFLRDAKLRALIPCRKE